MALAPGSTIGILGGGQLGRMLAMAAARLGFQTHIYCEQNTAPAFDVATRQTVAGFGDVAAIEKFAQDIDVATFEFENIPASAIDVIARHTNIYPSKYSLEVTQDRLYEKRSLSSMEVGTADYLPVDSLDDLHKGIDTIGCPAILKTRRFGYDGKGQIRIESDTRLEKALGAIGKAPAILEKLVAFSCEISLIAVRNLTGQVAFYDPVENTHAEQILKTSVVPANIPNRMATQAQAIVEKIVEKMDYVGVIAVEFFHLGQGSDARLLVNEIAPRVHNSGHWSIDACITDQFENHIRAIAGWPLGSANRHSNVVMTNLIGHDADNWRHHAGLGDTTLHLYGKSEVKPGRKMGHITKLLPKNANL
jgi:5-(carboxyamino)imidazole ribonucleotide synthase